MRATKSMKSGEGLGKKDVETVANTAEETPKYPFDRPAVCEATIGTNMTELGYTMPKG